MNTKLNTIAASFAFCFAAGAYAQTSAGSSGASAQGDQSSGSSSGQPSQKQQIREQHKAAMEKCDGMEGNAKDICKAEADGQKEIAEAQEKLTQRDTPKNRLELAEAKAKAQYEVAKEKCDDQVGDAKKACEQSAKADRDNMLAEAKKESQTQSATGSSASGSTASGSSAEPSTPSSGSSSSDSSTEKSPPEGGSTPGSSSVAPTTSPERSGQSR